MKYEPLSNELSCFVLYDRHTTDVKNIANNMFFFSISLSKYCKCH